MQGTPKAIAIQGIVRNLTKISVQDGQAEDLINLRLVDGSWRASGDGRLVHTMTGTQYQQLYVHTNIYHHLLGVNPTDSKLYWFAEIGNDGVSFYPLQADKSSYPEDMQDLPDAPVELTSVVGDIWITQNGHLLTVIDEDDDFEYLVFKTGENAYHNIEVDVNGKATDRKLFPFGRVHFNIITDDTEEYTYSEKDDDQYIVNDKDDIDFPNSTACVPKSDESETHTAYKIWQAQMLKVFKKAEDDNRFTGTLLALVAIRLYDGSYAYASAPVFIHPRDGVKPTVQAVATEQLSDYANTHNARLVTTAETVEAIHLNGGFYTAYKSVTYDGKDDNPNALVGIKDGVATKLIYDEDHPTVGQPKPVFTSGASSTLYALSGFASGIFEKNVMESVVRGADLAISIEDINTILQNKDIFSGIGIFITTQSHLYNMAADGYKEADVRCQSHKESFNNTGTWVNTIASNISYRPEHRSHTKIIYDLTHSPFFLLRDYSTSELSDLQSECKIDLSGVEYESRLANITQQKRLDYEATNRTTYLPKVSYMYNGRLHIANYKSYPFFGYPLDLFHLHNHSVKVQADSWFPADQDGKRVLPNLVANNDDYLQYEKAQQAITNYADLVNAGAPYFLVKVYIDSAQGDQVVTRYIKAYNPSPSENGRADFIEDLNPILTYPDVRAKKMEIYYVYDYRATSSFEEVTTGLGTNMEYFPAGVYVKSKSFELTPHPYLNMAYYIDPDLKPIKLSSFTKYPPVQPINEQPVIPGGIE